jgi:hypothetical protein
MSPALCLHLNFDEYFNRCEDCGLEPPVWLQESIREHEDGECHCELAPGGYGLCYAGQLVEGVITLEEALQGSPPEKAKP